MLFRSGLGFYTKIQIKSQKCQSAPHCQTYLGEHITKSPSDEGGARFGSQWVLVQRSVVSSPSWNCSSANDERITKERRCLCTILAKRTGVSVDRLIYLTRWVNTKGAGRKERGSQREESEKLHLAFSISIEQ